jgi:tetratricopeptide (TPR) repeat protein
MRRIFLSVALALPSLSLFAQQPDAKTAQETARDFTRQGDYSNAVIVLNAALQKDSQNLELQKDLAFNYYLEHEYAKGLNVVRPLVDRTDADVQVYQMAGMFYKAIDDPKECDRLYKAGIKRFPHSGVLYNEYAEMLYALKETGNAIKVWEKGIEIDPNYSPNYYNACKYYYVNNNKVWCLLYGEAFINLESYSKRTTEIKDLLLDEYKLLFVDAELLKSQPSNSPFAAAYLNIMSKLTFMVSRGVTAESLTSLRTKFILNWFDTYPTNFPYRLFDYQRQLLKEGMFNAYNEWIFGAVESQPSFQSWTQAHSDEYNRFSEFQKGRIFRIPEGQYYQGSSK